MRIVSVFNIGKDQAVCIPAEMAYEGTRELEIRREGDVTTLRPARPSWTSLRELPKADPDFLHDRGTIVQPQPVYEIDKEVRDE